MFSLFTSQDSSHCLVLVSLSSVDMTAKKSAKYGPKFGREVGREVLEVGGSKLGAMLGCEVLRVVFCAVCLVKNNT